jgi:hypothetical protein
MKMSGRRAVIASNACLSVPNASRQQDVQLDQWNCDLPKFADQSWTVYYDGRKSPLPV